MYTHESEDDEDERIRQLRIEYKDSSLYELLDLYIVAVKQENPKPEHIIRREREVIEEIIEERDPIKKLELYFYLTTPVFLDDARAKHLIRCIKPHSKEEISGLMEK